MKLPAKAALFASLLAGRGAVPPKAPDPGAELGPAVVRQYADIAHAAYQDAALGARHLLAAADRLVAQPTPALLQAARAAWLSARPPYTQSETFRFSGGPIDQVEMLVNTWPIDESYIESATGIVNDSVHYPTLTADLLAQLNVKEGETSVSTGYHAIEFLLWAPTRIPTAPAIAPRSTTALPVRMPARRAAAGSTCTWWPTCWSATSIRSPPRGARERPTARTSRPCRCIIKGMGALGGAGLAGERLTVALATKDQENEHSCFSDSTHADIVQNATGIQNLCLGRYRRTDGTQVAGPGLCELLGRLDAGLGQRLVAQVAEGVEAARSIPPPFDQAILGNDAAPSRLAIQRTITALEAQTSTLSQAAAALGIGLMVTASVQP